MAPPTRARDGNIPEASGQDGGVSSVSCEEGCQQFRYSERWFTGNPWGRDVWINRTTGERSDVRGYQCPQNLPEEIRVPKSMLFSAKAILGQRFCLRHGFQLWHSCISVLGAGQRQKREKFTGPDLVYGIWFYFTPVPPSLWRYSWHC